MVRIEMAVRESDSHSILGCTLNSGCPPELEPIAGADAFVLSFIRKSNEFTGRYGGYAHGSASQQGGSIVLREAEVKSFCWIWSAALFSSAGKHSNVESAVPDAVESLSLSEKSSSHTSAAIAGQSFSNEISPVSCSCGHFRFATIEPNHRKGINQ